MQEVFVTVFWIVLAYVLVDFLTGAYHFITDLGWNLKYQVKLFQDHHVTNTMTGFDWQPCIVAIPAMLCGLYVGSVFLTFGGIFGCVSQVPHYYAHRRSKSQLVHHLVRVLQLSGVIISPDHHKRHHDGKFDQNFCILSGWNNWWLNPLLRGQFPIWEALVVLIACAFAGARWWMPSHPVSAAGSYEAFAHLFLGALLGAWGMSRLAFLLYLAIALSAVELAAFFLL